MILLCVMTGRKEVMTVMIYYVCFVFLMVTMLSVNIAASSNAGFSHSAFTRRMPVMKIFQLFYFLTLKNWNEHGLVQVAVKSIHIHVLFVSQIISL